MSGNPVLLQRRGRNHGSWMNDTIYYDDIVAIVVVVVFSTFNLSTETLRKFETMNF